MKDIIVLYEAFSSLLQRMNWIPLLMARLSIASVFIVTGWGKLHNLPKVIGYFTDLGLPMPEFQARLVAVTEFGCGSLILLGLLTRLASIPLMITMVVAIITAKASDIKGVADLLGLDEFLYIVFFVFFIVNGAGAVSVDGMISYWRGGKAEKSGPLRQNRMYG